MDDYSIGIKTLVGLDKCPYCGTTEVEETRKWAKHCSGHWNESIKFSCKATFAFSPNFMCVGLSQTCNYDPEFKARKKLVDDVRDELYQHAVTRGVLESDLKKLKEHLQFWNVSRSW